MSITDELREFMAGADGYELWCPRHKAELISIADRIDAEHERAVNYAKLAFWHDASDEELHHYGLARGPLDSDGAWVKEGDRVCDVVDSRPYRTVRTLEYINGTWLAWLDGDTHGTLVKMLHHYHEPTVEDVLKEMCDALNDARMPLGSGMISEEIIAEYAAKLQIKESE